MYFRQQTLEIKRTENLRQGKKSPKKDALLGGAKSENRLKVTRYCGLGWRKGGGGGGGWGQTFRLMGKKESREGKKPNPLAEGERISIPRTSSQQSKRKQRVKEPGSHVVMESRKPNLERISRKRVKATRELFGLGNVEVPTDLGAKGKVPGTAGKQNEEPIVEIRIRTGGDYKRNMIPPL